MTEAIICLEKLFKVAEGVLHNLIYLMPLLICKMLDYMDFKSPFQPKVTSVRRTKSPQKW